MSAREPARIRATVDDITVNADDVKLASLVTDDGAELVLPLALLPDGTQDGDVLLISIKQDRATRAARRKRVANLQERLFGASPAADDDPPDRARKGEGFEAGL